MAIATNIMNFIRGRNAPQTALLKKITQQLEFKKSTPLTVGVECEFGIVTRNYAPAHVGLDIVNEINNPHVQYELYKHMIEITTGICDTVNQAESDLAGKLAMILARMPAHETELVGAGSLPMLMLEQTEPVETERYQYLRERRKALYERFTTLGMHIHVGMEDEGSCIRFHNFFMHFLPHLLALSANSPFEEGRDTGFASIRPTITESMPIGGLPYQFRRWQDYRELCLSMARADSIADLKDLWWDLRPCPRYGTIEIRVCDQPATLAEAAAIAALVHCLGHWFSEHQGWLEEMPRPDSWRMRENKWRAMRYGLDASLVTDEEGHTRPVRDEINEWLDRLDPIFTRLEYGAHKDMIRDILARGNGAERQRRVFRAAGNLEAVYAHCIAELRNGRPLWDAVDAAEETAEGAATEPAFKGHAPLIRL